MPYSRKAKYHHHRQRDPKLFFKHTFRTIPVKKAIDAKYYSGSRFNKKGVMAVIGKLRKTGKWTVQKFMVPK